MKFTIINNVHRCSIRAEFVCAFLGLEFSDLICDSPLLIQYDPKTDLYEETKEQDILNQVIAAIQYKTKEYDTQFHIKSIRISKNNLIPEELLPSFYYKFTAHIIDRKVLFPNSYEGVWYGKK